MLTIGAAGAGNATGGMEEWMNGQYNTYDGAGGCSDTRRRVFRRAGSRMNDPCSLAGGRLSLAGARLLDLTPHWHWLSPSHRSPHLTGRQRVFVSLSRTITSHVTHSLTEQTDASLLPQSMPPSRCPSRCPSRSSACNWKIFRRLPKTCHLEKGAHGVLLRRRGFSSTGLAE